MRYSKENNIELGLRWNILDNYDTDKHLLNCNLINFSNNIKLIEEQDNENEKYYINYLSPCFMIFNNDNIPSNFDS